MKKKRYQLFVACLLVVIIPHIIAAWPMVSEHPKDPPVVYIGVVNSVFDTPILAVFKDGTLLFNESYFFANEGDFKSRSFYSANESQEVIEQRKKQIKTIIESLDKGSDIPLVDQFLEQYQLMEPKKPVGNGELLLEGNLDADFIQRLFTELNEIDLRSVPGKVVRSQVYLKVCIWDQDEYFQCSGPFGRYYNSELVPYDIDTVLTDGNELIWDKFIGCLLSSIHYLDSMTESSCNSFYCLKETYTAPWLNQDFDLPSSSNTSSGVEVDKITNDFLMEVDRRWKNEDKDTVYNDLKETKNPLGESNSGYYSLKMGYLATSLGKKNEAEVYFKNAAKLLKGKPQHSDALMRCAYIDSAKYGKGKALDYFSLVALGLIPASNTHQLHEAQYRTAMLLPDFRQRKEFLQHVIRNSGEGSLYDTARLQIMGVTFEEAKGDYYKIDKSESLQLLNQTRELGRQLVEKENVDIVVKATAELMMGETYYYEENFHRCHQELTSFMEKWNDYRSKQSETAPAQLKKLVATAHTYAMISAFFDDQEDEGLRLAESLSEENYSKNDFYQSFNGLAYSLAYRSIYHGKKKNQIEADYFNVELEERYPEWKKKFYSREKNDFNKRMVRIQELKSQE